MNLWRILKNMPLHDLARDKKDWCPICIAQKEWKEDFERQLHELERQIRAKRAEVAKKLEEWLPRQDNPEYPLLDTDEEIAFLKSKLKLVDDILGLLFSDGEKETDQKMKRVQRKRTKGWRMPPNTVYVGRPTKWGNPYGINGLKTETVLVMYDGWLRDRLGEDPYFLDLLKGKDLACWCPLQDKNGNPVPCHADVLLKFLETEK